MHFGAFAKRHPIATFYALVFGISWGSGLFVLGPNGFVGGTPISTSQMPLVYLAALAGPGIAGVLATALVSGRPGLRDLRSRWLRWRVSPGWYAVALLTAPLLALAILLTLSLVSTAFVPPILTESDRASLLLPAIVIALLVPIFEETGWTGFVIPQFSARSGVVTTGLIVGLLWGAWHFPMFAASANAFGAIPPALYLAVLLFAWLPPYRVLMVWVYAHTKSILVAMLMHVPIVINGLVLIPTSSPEVVFTFDVIFAAALWVLVAGMAASGWMRGVARASVTRRVPSA